MAQLPEDDPTTVDSCQYRLVMTSTWSGGWRGGYLALGKNPYSVGAVGLNQDVLRFAHDNYGTVTTYFYLPKGWVSVEYHNMHPVWSSNPWGTFSIYDENDSLIFQGPENLPEYFLWYNGCGYDMPDSAMAFSHSVQNNVVDLSWTNPITSVKGDTLNALSKVEIRRNEELIHTFTNALPGESMTFSDNVTEDGTYIYTVQCFNAIGGGIPVIAHTTIGSNWVLHNHSCSGQYVDTACMMSISNDSFYTYGGQTTLTIHQSDTTKMLKISGYAIPDSNAHIEVYAGTPENGLLLSSDSLTFVTPYRSATFIFDFSAGSSPEFHYTVECVNSFYEQPDTNIAIVPDSNGIIYVTQEGAGLRNGSSWANATPWLNRALEAAGTMTEKPVIWVAKGTYYGTSQVQDNVICSFIGRNGVNVFGGFAGNEPANYNLSLRDLEQNKTVLDGMLYSTVLYIGEHSAWNGFHLQRGTNGCKLKSHSGLKHCTISDCIVDGIHVATIGYYGISYIDIDSCLICHNGGNGIGGDYPTNLNLSHTTISYNGGTGLGCTRISNISYSFITNNGGHGVYDLGGNIHHCLIANNDGSGLYDGSFSSSHNTIVNNVGNGVVSGLKTTFRNTIISGNGGASISKYSNFSSYELIHCAVEGDYIRSSYNNIALASSNDTNGFNVGFVNPTSGIGKEYNGGDWHLLPTSVCVNRGITTYDNYPTVDLDGNARIQQGIPDIGAYESPYVHPYEEGKIIYVKTDGNGNGSSWTNAMADLDVALETAWIYGPETRVWVAQGTYPTPNQPFYVKDNLRLVGSFVGNEPADYNVDLRNTLTNATILDGQQQNRVLYQTCDLDNSAYVDGFTLTRGQADEGAGAYLMANTTLSKCRVVNNTATGENAVVIAVRDTLKQLMVENNNGTGIAAESSQLLHCTVVKNNGYGIRFSGTAVQDSNLLWNSIVWGNALQNLCFTSSMAKNNTQTQHCAIENQIVEGEGNITLTSGNMEASGPHFINPTDSVGVVSSWGDWHIDSSSVCVNTGSGFPDSYNIHTDLSGLQRVQNGRADIGALESTYKDEVLCRNMEAYIYEGENYTFYDTILTNAGWYEHRWNVGEADSLVVLRLITKSVVYVSVTGSGLKDGSSWANALDGQTATANGSTKLADALQNAAAGTEFWIQSGTYYACSDYDANKSLMLNGGVALYGGFEGTETAIHQRDTSNAQTVFSGNLQNDSIMENNTRIIFNTHNQNSPDHAILLDNITISEGYNNSHEGSALRINLSSAVSANHCRIHHHFGGAIVNNGMFSGNFCALDSNESYCDYWNSYIGAAAFINNASGVSYLRHCTVTNNQAPWDGALYNIGNMTIDSSYVAYNKATQENIGAIRNEQWLTISNSVLSNNWAFKGISTISSNGVLKLFNCIVDSNQSLRVNPEVNFLQGSFPHFSIGVASHILVSGVADIENCQFRKNSQNRETEGGCVHVNGIATIKKCDFSENIGAGVFSPGQGGMLSVEYNHSGIDGCVYVGSGSVTVEECRFDNNYGGGGIAACVESGKLTMDRCVFTNHQRLRGIGQEGIIAIQSGELLVQNSLFANNQNAVFNTAKSAQGSRTSFSNCTFVNNMETFCIFNEPELWHEMGQYHATPDTAYVRFQNSIIIGNWEHTINGINAGGTIFHPNYFLQFTNTLFHHPDSTLATDCTPDSLGNIYYCDPMFVNPTTVMGVDSIQNPLLYDFRLLPGSPAINSGDTTGLSLTANATDLDGERRVKRCTIDRGCYEFGVIDYDTIQETFCVESDSLEQTTYNGHGFSIAQLNVGENSFTRNCDCHPDANDTVLTLQLFVSLIQHTAFDTVVCDSMVWNDMVYAQSGTYTQTLTDATGCDSVVTMHLTVNSSTFSEMVQEACNSYEWNGTTYTESGVYTQTFTNAVGCDSVATLYLTLYHDADTVIHDHFCNGSFYSFFGQELYGPGTYTHVGQTVHGCDSTVTLQLELKQNFTSFINANLCNGEGYDFFGEMLYEAGTYTQVLPTVFGCDSTVILTLTTGATTYGTLDVSICDGSSYHFHGQQLTEAGDYTITLTNSSGCDSIVTLHLTVSNTDHTDYTDEACDSYVWNGETYTLSGDYTQTFANASGCDSVVTLHLTVNQAASSEFTIVTEEPCYTWNGIDYCASGDYTQHLQTIHGCDSVVTLHLTITVGLDDHDGFNFYVYPNPTNGIVNVEYTMRNDEWGKVEWQVVDIYGKLIRTVETICTSSLQRTVIDISDLANGVYFVKAVADGKTVAVRKVAKN